MAFGTRNLKFGVLGPSGFVKKTLELPQKALEGKALQSPQKAFDRKILQLPHRALKRKLPFHEEAPVRIILVCQTRCGAGAGGIHPYLPRIPEQLSLGCVPATPSRFQLVLEVEWGS